MSASRTAASAAVHQLSRDTGRPSYFVGSRAAPAGGSAASMSVCRWDNSVTAQIAAWYR
ncbi:hypothetical protein [Streptomyces sp. NPDC006333]|uniref:hypothetical protein n=1 Tax=Streptomyces sp. NPDC006333 TaxID=3156753 RepID=UPI0033B436C7